MDVLKIEEQEDGSAIITLNMTQKENDMLVEHAVIDILKKQIERMDNKNKKECFDCGEEVNNETIKEFPDT